jgi:hypothetical protein
MQMKRFLVILGKRISYPSGCRKKGGLTRAGTKITEIKGSHVLFISQPDAVANVIIAAANDLNTNQLK